MPEVASVTPGEHVDSGRPASVTMRLGVAGSPLPTDSEQLAPALVAELRTWGVTSVALHLQNRDGLLNGEARRVRDLLASHDISVSQFTGFQPNLIHPDRAVRRAGLDGLRAALAIAHELGADMVNTGCGSLNPTSSYGPHPDNYTAVARRRLIESLREASHEASARGLILSLESHIATTLSDPVAIRSIVEEVQTPSLRVNFDPVNLLNGLKDAYNSGDAIRRMWDELGPYFGPSAHVKDVRPVAKFLVHIDEVEPGTGTLDWDAYFEVCQRLGDRAALIVEHLRADQVASALSFVRETAHRYGVELAK